MSQVKTKFIANLAVTAAKISSGAATNGQVLTADGSGNAAFSSPAAVTTVLDGSFRIDNTADNTKQIAFSAAGITTGTTRTITMPDANVDLGNLTNSNISATAAIAASKLALTGAIVLADLASNSVDENKIVSTAFSSTGAITGGSGTKIAVAVDGTSTAIASDQLTSLKPQSYAYTLSSTDITNQYVDITTGNGFASSNPAYGTTALKNSVEVVPNGGPLQTKGVDFTVSLTGGSGGSTRVTFAGDLATGGNAALVSGDIVTFNYASL